MADRKRKAADPENFGDPEFGRSRIVAEQFACPLCGVSHSGSHPWHRWEEICPHTGWVSQKWCCRPCINQYCWDTYKIKKINGKIVFFQPETFKLDPAHHKLICIRLDPAQ